jgi:PBSX family phage terminase large subunit
MTTSSIYKAFDTSKMPKQRRFMESIAKELMYSGSFGAGKSRVGCEKGLFLSLKYPNNKGLIIRKTFASLRLTTMDTWERYVCAPEYITSFPKDTHICKLKNGSEIIFLGLNDSPERIGSLEVGWIFIDEAIEFDESDYVMLQGRLRLNTVPFRQMLMATNPASGQHFLYRKFFTEQDPDCEVIEANSLDNPYNPQDYTDNLMKLKGRYKERYVLGQWIGYEGLVYDIVDPLEAIIEPFDIPSHWPRYAAIDFGYTNPFVYQWWAKCPEEEETEEIKGYYLYREIYTSHQTIVRLAPRIKVFHDPVSITFSDHDAEDRATLEDEQILTSLADKAIGPGIQTVFELFGEHRIHFFADACVEVDNYLSEHHKPTCTSAELGNYRWADASRTINAKEIPIDRDNHGMDAMRYLFHTMLGGGEPQTVMSRRDPSKRLPGRDWGRLLVTGRNWKRE